MIQKDSLNKMLMLKNLGVKLFLIYLFFYFKLYNIFNIWLFYPILLYSISGTTADVSQKLHVT